MPEKTKKLTLYRLPTWKGAFLNPAVMLNVVLSTIELLLLAAHERQFGTKNMVLVILAEFIKMTLTTGIIALLWKNGFYISAYVIALLPFILIIPAGLMLLTKTGKFGGMVRQ